MIITLFYVLHCIGQYLVNKMQNSLTSNDKDEREEECAIEENVNPEHLRRRFSESSDEENQIRFSPPASIQRYRAVEKILRQTHFNIRKVVEFGCAGLRFTRNIKRTWTVEEALFVDVDRKVLEENKFKIEPKWEDYDCLREKPLSMYIYEGSVTEYNELLDDTDAVICIELIEHLHMPDVEGMTTNIFKNIQPSLVVITTPNKDFNVVFKMKPTEMRHWDHKFEWTRKEFENWANSVIKQYPDYEVNCETVVEGPFGTEDLGGCSQVAVFSRLTSMKNPVTEKHGDYKKVYEQIYPYLTDDLLHECIVGFITEHEKQMKDCGMNRSYFLNDEELKKSTVKYEEFDFYDFKSRLPHKITKNRLMDALEQFGIKVIWTYHEKMVAFPYVEGEVEFEEKVENEKVEELIINENWEDSCNSYENWTIENYCDNETDFYDDDNFELVSSNFKDKDDSKDSSPKITTEVSQPSPLKRSNSPDESIENLPSMYSFNLEKSQEGSNASIDAFNPFLKQKTSPNAKKPRLDIEGFSFRDAIENYNQKNGIDSFKIVSPKQSSTPKIFKASESTNSVTKSENSSLNNFELEKIKLEVPNLEKLQVLRTENLLKSEQQEVKMFSLNDAKTEETKSKNQTLDESEVEKERSEIQVLNKSEAEEIKSEISNLHTSELQTIEISNLSDSKTEKTKSEIEVFNKTETEISKAEMLNLNTPAYQKLENSNSSNFKIEEPKSEIQVFNECEIKETKPDMQVLNKSETEEVKSEMQNFNESEAKESNSEISLDLVEPKNEKPKIEISSDSKPAKSISDENLSSATLGDENLMDCEISDSTELENSISECTARFLETESLVTAYEKSDKESSDIFDDNSLSKSELKLSSSIYESAIEETLKSDDEDSDMTLRSVSSEILDSGYPKSNTESSSFNDVPQIKMTEESHDD